MKLTTTESQRAIGLSFEKEKFTVQQLVNIPFSLIESNVDDNHRHKLSESKIPIPYLINLNSKLDIDRTIQLVFVLMFEQHWIVQHILPLSA